MKVTLLVAATEYFADRGYSWSIARLSAAIAMAVYALLIVFTIICLHYAVAEELPDIVHGLSRMAIALCFTVMSAIAWTLIPSKGLDAAEIDISRRVSRRRLLKIYCALVLGMFIISVVLVLARMSS